LSRRAGLTLELNNYNQFKRELSNLDRTISSINRRIDRIGNAFDRMERESKQAGRTTKQTARDIDRTSRDIERSTSRIDRASEAFNQVGGALTAGFTAPFLLFKNEGIKAASAFEDGLVDIQTRANLSAAELEKVQQKALDIGRDTQFSAQQGADAFLQLLTSGQSVTEAFETVDSVITGAAASGESLGFVSDTLTDIMAAFNLEASASQQVLDDLVAASGSSSASISEIAQGFQNVGGVAREFGLSTRETSAILALFSENGIKGAEAGTQLRSMLNNLSRDTEDVNAIWNELDISLFDVDGTARPLATVMDELRTSLDGMSDADRIRIIKGLAGTYGQLGLSALTSGESIEDMLAKMDEAGVAGDIASAKMQTLSGRFAFLRGSIETLLIKAFIPFNENNVKPFVDNLSGIVNRMSEWVDQNPALTQQLLQIGSAIALIGPAMILAVQATPLLLALGASLSVVFNPVVLAIIASIGLAINDIRNNIGGAGDAFNEFRTSFGSFFQAFGNTFSAIAELIGVVSSKAPEVERTWSPVTIIFQTLSNILDRMTSGLNAVTGFTKILTGTQLDNLTPFVTPEQNKLLAEREELTRDILDLEAGLVENADCTLGLLVEQGDTLDSLAQKYGIAREDLFALTNGDITAGSTIDLPVDVDVDNLDLLKSRIESLNEEIQSQNGTQLDFFLGQFAQTDLFTTIFGDDPEAVTRVKNTIIQFRDELLTAKTFAQNLGIALQNIISGDTQTDFQQLRDVITDTVTSVKNLLDTFTLTSFSPEEAEFIAMTGGTVPQNPIVQFIDNSVSQADGYDFTLAKQVLSENLLAIVRGAVSIAAIALGGPVGAVVGIGNLVVTAIERDFLGIGTALESSGILPAVRTAMATIQTEINNIINSTFGDGDNTASELDATGFVNFEPTGFSDRIGSIFDNIISGLSKISNDPIIDIAISVLESIRNGITGFIQAVNNTDTSSFGAAASTIGNALDIMLNALAIVGGGVIKGIFDTLPAVGEALALLFEGVGNLLSGNPELAIQNIFDAIQTGLTGIASLPINTIDSIIEFFNTVTGSNVPSLSGQLQAIGDEVSRVFNNIASVIDLFLIQVDKFLLDLRIKLNDALTALNIDTGVNSSQLRTDLANVTLEEEIRNTLSTGEPVDIDVPINYQFEGQEAGGALVNFLSNQDIVDSFSGSTIDMIQQLFDQLPADQQQILMDLGTIQFDVSNSTPEFIGEIPDPSDAFAGLFTGIGDSIGSFLNGGLGDSSDAEPNSFLGNLLGGVDAFAQGKAIGTNLDLGTAQGINEGFAAQEAAQGAATEIDNVFRTQFGIQSPSLVFMQYGMFMMQGLALGIQSMMFVVTTAVTQLETIFISAITRMSSGMATESGRINNLARIMDSTFSTTGQSMIATTMRLRSAIRFLTTEVERLAGAVNSVGDLNVNVSGSGGGGTSASPQNRYFGGNINAGQIYEFNERGLPFEIFKTRGRSFLLPNTSGTMISPANSSLYTPAPASGTTNNVNNTTTNAPTYEVNITIPATVTDVSEISADVIAAGITTYQESKSPRRRTRGSI